MGKVLVEVPLVGVDVAERTFHAGGSQNYPGGATADPQRFELYPGSTGSWYWRSYTRDSPRFMNPDTINGEIFKGTFIPIHSALALRPTFNVFNPPTTDDGQLPGYSAFDAVHTMPRPYNYYFHEANPDHSYDIDDRRFQHMVFDVDLILNMRRAVRYLESNASPVIDHADGTPGNWQGCRGDGLWVCSEKTSGYPNYFTNHPRCVRNETCGGQFYTCNEACPAPNELDR